MKLFFKAVLIFSFLSVTYAYSQTDSIVFSEVMFYPSASNSEFIELHNLSTHNSADISKYQIMYSTSNADTIIAVEDGTIIPPNSFAVIFEGDYDLITGIYSGIVPVNVMKLKIDNNAFGSSGMANTSDRVIHLVDSDGDTVNVYQYTANNSAGISDEKIDLSGSSNSSNWANTLVGNGTPGFDNSVSTKEFDLTVSYLFYTPSEIFEGEEVQFAATVKNIGISPASNFSVQIFADTNFDSLVQSNELIIEENFQNLSSDDSIQVVGISSGLPKGAYSIFATVNYSEDQKLENNLASTHIEVFSPKNKFNDIVISEIMYGPTDNEPEWLEIINLSESAINLNDWRIEDRSSSARIADSTYTIQPGEFIVLSDDENIYNYYNINSSVKVINLPSLNNSDDDLKLLDSLKRTIDSVSYSKAWGGEGGYSLEKISVGTDGSDSTNWGTSVNPFGGTPGKENSLTPKANDLAITKFYLNESYTVISKAEQFNILVKNIGTENAENFSLQVYNDVNVDSIGEQNEIVFESNQSRINVEDSILISFESTDFVAGANQYIAELVYAEDMDLDNNRAYVDFIAVELNEVRNDLIINEIMYAPQKPEPEWIELFNRSNKTINLKNYQIADEVDSARILQVDRNINPLEYFVIAKDASFVELYRDTLNLIISDFPNLNNSGDKVIILDSLNRVIDSVQFNPDWGGTSGISLERFDTELSSVDSTNWQSATIDSGGTPGMLNSISQREYDLELSALLFDPTFPSFGDQVSISVKVKNVGKSIMSTNITLSEDLLNDTTSFTLIETRVVSDLTSGDSTQVIFNFQIDSIKSEHGFLVEINSDTDQDSTNDKLYSTIAPGYSYNAIVVNEIMYSPINGEPEWVELFNTSEEQVNLKNWSISDILTTSKSYIISENDLVIGSTEYLVISKDSTIWDYHSSIPSHVHVQKFANLNNDVDGIVIKDLYGNRIDSVQYQSKWGGTSGYSLERRFHYLGSDDSTNWDSSIDIELSTPGRKNSITPKDFDLRVSEIKPIPEYPTVGEEVFIEAKIYNIGVNFVNNFSVKFDKLQNDILTELSIINNLNLSIGDSLIVQSTNSFQLVDSAAIFVSVIFDEDNDTTNNFSSLTIKPGFLKNSILINEFIANANTDEAEWIEFYNNSGNIINIKNWSVSDFLISPTKKIITEKDVEIAERELFIIANDTSKFDNAGDSKVFEVKFGALGNTEDGILIYDFNDKIIDSLRYNKDWRIEKGRSLERVSFDVPTYDLYNWLPSLSISGSTPGSSNSIIETKLYDKGNVTINEIMFDPDTDNSEFIELYNSTDSSIDIGGWSLIDGSDNYFEISKTFLELPANEFLIFYSDSLIFNSYPELDDNQFTKMSGDGDLSLSNDEESLIIIDHWGNMIDSINYNSDWHNQNIHVTKNRSLERINPNIDGNEFSNWSTSVDPSGATPAKENSIFIGSELSETKLSFSPNPFSPDNDGFEDFSIISYNLSANTAQIRIKIFDDKGRLVRTLVNNKASAVQGSVIFDGLDDSGNPLKIGMYIVFLEASNSSSGVVDVLKDVIVVARKL